MRIPLRGPALTAVMGSYDDTPSEPGLVSQYRNLLHHFVHQVGREKASTFWAGCGAVRRGAFQLGPASPWGCSGTFSASR